MEGKLGDLSHDTILPEDNKILGLGKEDLTPIEVGYKRLNYKQLDCGVWIKAFLIIHGTVQGVGYRHFVRGVAVKSKIRGFVRNADDGSVEVFADGAPENLKAFEKEIDVSERYGPQVFKIERSEEKDPEFPKNVKKYKDFIIVKDE